MFRLPASRAKGSADGTIGEIAEGASARMYVPPFNVMNPDGLQWVRLASDR